MYHDRCALPFDLGTGVLDPPLDLPFSAGRFFGGWASVPGGFACTSFCTIFAWISSSFDALTFFGQNSVTNLESGRPSEVDHGSRKAR